MGSPARDSAPEAPVAPEKPADRRLPLKVVVFREPTSVPGLSLRVTTVEAGKTMVDGPTPYVSPQAFLDPLLRSIYIEGREYPLEAVHYWERARLAVGKKELCPLPDYRIGKLVPPL